MKFTHKRLAELIEFLATKNLDINHSESEMHFAKCELEVIIAGSQPNGLESPAIVLEKSEGTVGGNSTESAHKARLFAFHVLKRANEVDATDVENKQEECEEIADEILAMLVKISQYKFDFVDDNDELLFPWIDPVDLSTVRIQPEEMIFDNWFGVRVQMQLSGSQQLIVEDSKWDL